MSILSVESVRKSYGIKPLLTDVSFGLEANGKMGVIGANGSGKTTLLRIIAGVEPPDGGSVVMPSAVQVAYLSQNPPLNPKHTILDAVFDQGDDQLRLLHDYEEVSLSLEKSGDATEAQLTRLSELSHQLDITGGWDLEANARAILDRLGLADPEERIGTLSGGQRKRVAMAAALVLRPDLLILDEPTNHLDPDTITWLEGYLESYSGALLLVTHDRYFLDRVTNRMLEIEGGSAQRFVGNYTSYLEQKEAQSMREETEAQKRESLAKRELAWLRRGAKARTTKQKARVDRAEALLGEPKKVKDKEIALDAPAARLGKKVVHLDSVTKGFDGRVLIRDLSHIFAREDRIGIIGPNGSGKTTLLEMIAGRLEPDNGSIERGPTTVVGYYDQESRALNDDQRIIEYIKDVAERVITNDGSSISASQLLERFLFPPAQQYTPIGLLSGGEKRRLYLARILMGAPNVLLLDEPTNDLDIQTLVALETYLDTFPGCLITVSHDRYFLDRTVEHVFQIKEGGSVRKIPGNYSAYLGLREREAAEANRAQSGNTPRPAPQVDTRQDASESPKLTFKERRELEELEQAIAQAEAKQVEIESQLASSPSDFDEVARISAELAKVSKGLEKDVERWAELAERV
ncbi:ABC-F family ATP-binding cassette domain-containing protein [soil metagenome]